MKAFVGLQRDMTTKRHKKGTKEAQKLLRLLFSFCALLWLFITLLVHRDVEAQTPSSPAGMMLEVTGRVTIERRGSPITPRLAELIHTGDRIRIEGGRATIMFCPSSEMLVLSDRSVIEIQSEAVRVVSGPQPTRSHTHCALPKAPVGQESMERVGGIRGRGNPPIALFVGGPVSTLRPVFEWGPVDGNPAYQLTLKNVDGDTLWQTRTSATKASYPETMTALGAGSYQWEVRAETAGRLVAEQSANFEIKPGAPAATPRDAPAMLVEAIRLENEGYYAEASSLFRELLKANPNDERISRHLAWLYWNAGLIAAFNAQTPK